MFFNDFAYITCGDLYYMDLIEKLVISILNTSSRKILVYGINCKVPFDYPNVIKREFITPVKTPYDKWFWKQQVCIESLKEGYKNYVWVDGDIIANNNIDSVSKYFFDIENYPIGEIHVQDEQIIYTPNGNQVMGEKICEHFDINRKVLKKDLHACFFVFNERCKWFFEEILQLYHSIYDQGLYEKLLGWNDESLHNFMHSKYGFTKTLPLSNLSLLCNHNRHESNPRLLRLFYGYWNEDSPNNFGERFGWSYVPEDKNQILYFHENKNLRDADEMIEFIKMKNNNSFNSSKWFFIGKYKIHNFEKEPLGNDPNQKYNECKLFEYREVAYIKPQDVVVDIGADIGFFERLSYLKNASKIICFEPDRNKFELLKMNAHKNSILFNAEVTNQVSEQKYSINYLFDTGLLDRIDFLKVDSKGDEFNVLNISDTNFQKISRISVKYYHNHYNYDDSIRANFISNVMRHGYHSMNNMAGDVSYIHFWKISDELYKWVVNNGDEVLSLTHDLNESSVVFDGGGYVGDWTKKIYNKYNCNLFVFEPVKSFYDNYLQSIQNDKIKCFQLGLSSENHKQNIYLSNEGSSVYLQGNEFEEIELVDIVDFMNKNSIHKIDLLKLNLEGEEYNILERLISSGKIEDVKSIQVQFHKITNDSSSRRNFIRNELAKTHNEVYCFEFIWEKWELK